MANLTESPVWEAGVYQLEITDPVLGGPNGVDNLQAKQLANRTQWLRQQIETLQAAGFLDQAAADALYAHVGHSHQGLMPAGGIIAMALSAAPTGYLECNGAAISRTTYADLFAAIGTTFGAGDGSTTFNLPDLRGEFIRGWDNGRGVDAGRALGSWQVDAFRSHMHQLNYWAWADGTGAGLHNYVKPVDPSGAISGVSNVGTYSTGDTETRPRNVALMFCIKY